MATTAAETEQTEPADEAAPEDAPETGTFVAESDEADQLAAPLWLPAHDAEVIEQSVARPPDTVQGYGLTDRLTSLFGGSRMKMTANGATAFAVLLFLVSAVGLDLGIGSLLKIAFYQAWTMGILLLVTRKVRAVSVWTLTRYWLAGMFLVTTLAHFVSGPLGSLTDRADVFVYPVVEELLKALPLGVAAVVGLRMWRHPGLSDFMVLGFAVGGGYGFHAAGLRGQTSASGLDTDFGFLVPSTLRADGLMVVGHAVSAALIGLAIGLFLVHRHQAIAVVAAATLVLATILDRMAGVDDQGALNWFRSLSFGGSLLGLLAVAGLVAAVILDRRRLGEIGERDHLFPAAQSGNRSVEPDTGDLLDGARVGRYRRLRNGIHTTVGAVPRQWPPLSESDPAPVAELARLARSAGVDAGPGSSPSGWAPDPDEPGRFRFAGPYGFTPYGAGEDMGPVGELPTIAALNDPGLDDDTRARMHRQVALAEERARRGGDSGPTTTTLSAARADGNLEAFTMQARTRDYWQYVGLATLAVGLFLVARLLTAGDLGDPTAVSIHLPGAATSPSVVVGVLGALATAVALRGRDQAEIGAGWDVGPGEDPQTVRPRECEV